MDEVFKKCSGCDGVKPATPEHFAKSDRAADRLRSSCRECDRIRGRARYGANKEEMQARAAARRAANPEKHREILKRSREKNREKRIKSSRAAYKKDPQKHRDRTKAYYEENRDRCNAATKSWRERLRVEMLSAYGGRCSCCGEDEPRFLTLEHVGLTGAEHRKLLKGQTQIYNDLRRKGWPKKGFTLLCWNCNLATSRGDECPHAIARRKGFECVATGGPGEAEEAAASSSEKTYGAAA